MMWIARPVGCAAEAVGYFDCILYREALSAVKMGKRPLIMQRSDAHDVGTGVGRSVAVGSVCALTVGVAVLMVADTVTVGGTTVRVAATLIFASAGVADGGEEAAAGMQPAKIRGSKHAIRSNKPANRRR